MDLDMTGLHYLWEIQVKSRGLIIVYFHLDSQIENRLKANYEKYKHLDDIW